MWGSCRGILEAVMEVQDRLLWPAMVEMWDVRLMRSQRGTGIHSPVLLTTRDRDPA